MFIGEYRHTIDEKGRMAIPIRFRSALAQGAVITRGLDGVYSYPRKEWDKLADKLASLPLGQADTRALLVSCWPVPWRLRWMDRGELFFQYLRQYAGLQDVVVAGLYNRLEIWDEATWKAYAAKTEAEGNQIAERLTNLGV